MQTRDYIIRRLMTLPLLLLSVSVAVFLLVRVSGSPIAAYVNPRMTQAEIQQLQERFHLGEPLPIQYFYWLRGLVGGDFGWSAVAAAPVAEIFPAKLAATVELAVLAAIIAIGLGVALGTFGGARRDRLPDHFTRIFAVSGASLPLFWLGLLLLVVFWLQLGWAPTGRFDTQIWESIPHPTHLYTIDALLATDLQALGDALAHLILPAITLGLATTALIVRMMRSSLVEELAEPYVDAARAKGLPEKTVVRRHARRNALIPTVTVMGFSVGFVLEGSVVVETVFQWPGLGQWMAKAIVTGDQAAIMTFVLFTGVLYVSANLAVDVTYAYLDPRVNLGE